MSGSGDLQMLFVLTGTMIVLHRGTDVDIREFQPGDVLAIILVAYGTRQVLNQ